MAASGSPAWGEGFDQDGLQLLVGIGGQDGEQSLGPAAGQTGQIGRRAEDGSQGGPGRLQHGVRAFGGCDDRLGAVGGLGVQDGAAGGDQIGETGHDAVLSIARRPDQRC